MNQPIRIALLCSAAWLSLNSNPGWAAGYPAPMTNPTVSDNCGNTAGGTKALFNNNIPCNPLLANTAFGYNALVSNVGGTDNTAVGGGALYFNSTGVYDTAVGAGALLNNTASYNTATGSGSLLNNTSGYSNSANGATALNANTTGQWKIANGGSPL